MLGRRRTSIRDTKRESMPGWAYIGYATSGCVRSGKGARPGVCGMPTLSQYLDLAQCYSSTAFPKIAHPGSSVHV